MSEGVGAAPSGPARTSSGEAQDGRIRKTAHGAPHDRANPDATSGRPVADAKLSAEAAQVLYAYARAVDEGDLDTLAALAHDDVALTRSDGTKHGRAAFLDLYRGFRDSDKDGSKHVVTNVQAFPEDGGLVRLHAYFEATMFDTDGGTRVVIGRYEDSLRDGGDGLRFAHKRITVERVVRYGASTSEWVGVAPKAEAP